MLDQKNQNRLEARDDIHTEPNLNDRMPAKIKRIGDYLIEDLVCDNTTINRALSFQKKLGEDGTYKPIGQIIVEGYGLESGALEPSIRRQGLDMLFSAGLFESLHPQMILKIAEVSKFLTLPKKTTIFKQGDKGDSFYLVISGRVRVYQVSDDGMEVTLATLGSCEGIGDMALLTGAPRSASVDTIEATSLLSVSKEAFDEIVETNPELSMAFTRILAERISAGNVHLVEASASERAYQRFAGESYAVADPRLIGKSKTVRKLRDRIQEVAQNDRPVMILGEPGTEKRDVAGLIHRGRKHEKNLFLVMDAKAVNLDGVTADRDKRDPLRLELAQNSTLFGHDQGALPFDQARRLGLLQVAHEGTVLIENVDQLANSVQAKLLDFIQSGYFLSLGGRTPIKSAVRIIATTTADLGQLAESGRFDQSLYNVLCGQTLTIKPLRRRKRDLSLIVEHFIEIFNEEAVKSVRGISKEAYKNIMTYHWPGNTDELKVVIRRAVNLAQSEWLVPENIFIGLAPISGKLTFNLLKLDRILRLFRHKAFPIVPQLATAGFFVLIICLGFFGSQVPDQNVSLVLTWGLWEPLVILSIIPAARIWCAICPVGALTALMNRYCSLEQDVPAFIRDHGLYLSAIGLGIIIWSEAAYRMLYSPRATAILILSIIVLAVIFGLIYRRRTWCRYLCPLGGLIGVYSRCSILELRSNYNICNSDCTTHSCYSGENDLSGCPMFEGPFSLRSNQNCILCGNCIKICPNESLVLNLRIPGNELWTLPKPSSDRVIAFFVSIIIGTQLFRGLENAGGFHPVLTRLKYPSMTLAVLLAMITLLTWFFVKIAGSFSFKSSKKKVVRKIDLMAYTLVPVATAFELGYHLERILNKAGQLLPVMGRQLGFDWGSLGFSAGLWLPKTIQILFIIIGALASKTVLKKMICSSQELPAVRLSVRQQWPIGLLALVYIRLFWTG